MSVIANQFQVIDDHFIFQMQIGTDFISGFYHGQRFLENNGQVISGGHVVIQRNLFKVIIIDIREKFQWNVSVLNSQWLFVTLADTVDSINWFFKCKTKFISIIITSLDGTGAQ